MNIHDFASERQRAIFIGNEHGQLSIPVAVEVVEALAQQKMTPEAYDYVAGGCGAEETLSLNLEAFSQWQIVPRILRDVSQRRLGVHLLGMDLPAPVLLAPVAAQALAHPEGELASARAAASLGLPFILSSVSSHSMEAVAAVMGDARRWFQLYWSMQPELTCSFLRRAEQAGYSAIVVTLDAMVLGWRERDLQNGFMPSRQALGIANYTSDPVFRAGLAKKPEDDMEAVKRHFSDVFANTTLTWKDLAWLRSQTRLPLIIKGVMHPEDARLVVEHGMDGLVVSNHGARQLDGSPPAIDALAPIVDVVAGRIPVLFDSGIRRGTDAFKAIALGANALLFGRPYIYALAVGGEQGVRESLQNLIADLDVTLALSGHTSFDQVGRDDLSV